MVIRKIAKKCNKNSGSATEGLRRKTLILYGPVRISSFLRPAQLYYILKLLAVKF